jgi:plasmid stabilization system protein ParE
LRPFDLTPEAVADLREIWQFISQDSVDAADRVLDDFYESFARLAATPGMGHKREDLTRRDVRFWPIYSYLVIYQLSSRPLLVIAVLHGNRDVKRLLQDR